MNNFITRALLRLINKFGYEIIPVWRLSDIQLELLLKKIIYHYRITSVIDVGANTGQYRDLIRKRVGFSGTINSFEPLPHLADNLYQLCKNDEKWHIHNVALGNENTVLPINIMASEVFSSFRTPESKQKNFFPGNTVVQTKNVKVSRLDDWQSNLKGITDNDQILLKIDTQGFDLEVILGAPEFLSRVNVLQFELAIKPIYRDVPHYSEIINVAQKHGFEISGFFPISHDDQLRAIELDCIMVKHQ